MSKYNKMHFSQSQVDASMTECPKIYFPFANKKAPYSFLPFEMFRNVSNQIILKDSLIRILWLHTNIIVLICTEVQVKFRFVCLINKVIKMYVLCTSLEPDILRPKSPQRRAKA